MSKEELFKHIRKEEVILWAGAGFSKYAGYPLGGELRDFIFSNMSLADQIEVGNNLPLDDMAEAFIRFNNGVKQKLLQLLEPIFHKNPLSTINHQLLAQIPHFRTIITTNYDRMFEQAYSDNSIKIFRDSDVTKWDKDKINILKIHGDFEDLDSIILTSKDYSTFYYKDKSAPLLSVITEKIATKVILFVGYGYEDSNIWGIFDHVATYTGTGRKDAYFLGHSLTRSKIEFLERNGIKYIDSSVEDFLAELLLDIKENIKDDLHKHLVSADTFRKFLNLHNIKPIIGGNAAGYLLTSLESLDGSPLNGNIKFTVDKDSDFAAKQKAFFEDDLDELSFEKANLENFRMDVEGLKFMGDDEFVDFFWKKTPSGVVTFDLSFLDFQFEIRNLEVSIYRHKKGIKFKLKIHTLSLEMNLINPKSEIAEFKWTMVHDENYVSVAEELEVYRFIKYFCSGEEITIFFKNGGHFSKRAPVAREIFISDADIFIDYFKKLQEVEKAFKVRFQNFYGINQGTLKDLNWLIQVIHKEQIEVKNSLKLKMVAMEDMTLAGFDKLNNGIYPLDIGGRVDFKMEIHGQQLPIKQKWIHVPSARVKNLTQLKKGKSQTAHVESRTGFIYETYLLTDELPNA